MARITVYTTEPCSYCSRAKALLGKRGLEYDEINLARDADGRAELVQRTGMMTFPQVIIGEEIVGGFTELLAADQSGRLAQLLAA
jgi:glutaredoxin 3